MSGLVITAEDESRLRELAYGIAKDIEDAPTLIARLGFTIEQFEDLAQTKMWQGMLDQAMSEWQGAGNVAKRVKLKAAVNIEQGLHHMYAAMIDPKEPLSSRVKVFEIMSRVGGLGNPEPMQAQAGSSFNLTIQLDSGREITINNVGDISPTSTLGSKTETYSESKQSRLLDGVEFEELTPAS